MKKAEDTFVLFDLSVEVIRTSRDFVCSHIEGQKFIVQGENLIFNSPPHSFSFYSLAALLPLLSAKQRKTSQYDWITTDADIACPDPNCGAIFRITRLAEREYKHSEVTRVPLPEERWRP